MFLALLGAALLFHFKGDKPDWFNSLSFYVEAPSIEYELATQDDDGNELDTLTYTPIVSNFNGFAVDTKWIGFALSIQNSESEYELFEESKLLDLQFFGTYKRFEWEVYYQNYQGLYITQEDEVAIGSRPAADSYSYGAALRYFVDEDFDPNVSFGSIQSKKITDGSWMVGVYGNHQLLESRTGLIPSEFQNNFDQLFGLTEFETTSLGIDGGYGGMYRGDWYYVTGFLTIGFQLQEQDFNGIDQEDRIVSGLATSTHLEFGYPLKHGVIGVRAKNSTLDIPIKNARFSQMRTQGRFFYKHYY